MRRLIESLVLLSAVLALNAYASSTRQYCEDMYPPESYDEEDRRFYIDECLQAYGDLDGAQDSNPGENDGYYEGTVEDYVETLPDEREMESAE